MQLFRSLKSSLPLSSSYFSMLSFLSFLVFLPRLRCNTFTIILSRKFILLLTIQWEEKEEWTGQNKFSSSSISSSSCCLIQEFKKLLKLVTDKTQTCHLSEDVKRWMWTLSYEDWHLPPRNLRGFIFFPQKPCKKTLNS